MTRSEWKRGFLVFGVLTIGVGSAAAQTITGMVTDTSGAAVPGVTVEVSSPALIEQKRIATTNDAGRYSIVDLVPGT